MITRKLAWRDKFVEHLEQNIADNCTGDTVVFPDSDTRLTLIQQLSQNEFTKLLSAVMTGADLSYPEDAHEVVWLLLKFVECAMSICEEIATCLENENQAIVDALASLIQNNDTILQAIAAANLSNGGGTPGETMTPQQSQMDTLPANARNEFGTCDYNALWGALLYLVQSGDRAITDFFQILESASNTLESATIISQAIPAVGAYAATAGEFADQMQENISEGYAAAYTEAYEQSLACDLFCAAREECALSIDTMLTVINDRLTSPLDIGDMGEIMAGIASGTWIGDEIADVAFLCFFSALKFGQQFGDTIGIRPLTDLMSLGSDFLASDNWTVLCDCPPLANRVPVIEINGTCVSSYSGDYGGTDITDLGEGAWSITASLNATTPADYRITIKDVDDRSFVMTDISHPGSSGCWGWDAVSGGCYSSGCSGGTDANGIEITSYFVTGTGVFTMTFTMSAP